MIWRRTKAEPASADPEPTGVAPTPNDSNESPADGSDAESRDRPNLLFIMTDQQRWDSLGVTGSPASTPALDALAADGVLFENAVTNSPVCIPARVSLASGLYPHQTGMWHNGVYRWPDGQQTWMEMVRRAGYHTAYFGKAHLGPGGAERFGLDTADFVRGPRGIPGTENKVRAAWEAAGLFDAYVEDLATRGLREAPQARPSVIPLELYYDVMVPDMAIEHLANLPKGNPWMTVLSFGGPHEPWDTPEPYSSMFDPASFPAPYPAMEFDDKLHTGLRWQLNKTRFDYLTDEIVATLRADYAGSVRLIDDKIAEVVQTVVDRGEWDNTIVIFSSDHGEMNGDHGMLYKSNFLNSAVRIPLIVRDPRSSSRGTRSDALVELNDVGATMCDYAGAESPAESCARSLRPVVDAPEGSHREYVVSEIRGETMVMNGSHKLMVNTRGENVFLTDQRQDRKESTNMLLAEAPAAPDALAELRDQLLRFHLTNRRDERKRGGGRVKAQQ